MTFKRFLCCCVAFVAVSHLALSDAEAARKNRRATRAQVGCSTIIPLGNVIWKGCAGSGHLSGDPRQKGVALIAPRGATLNVPACINILSNEYKKLGAMQIYSGNNGIVYKWRAYSNYGCGAGLTQQGLKTKSKGKPIYLQVGSGRCIKINKSFSNVNSSQSC